MADMFILNVNEQILMFSLKWFSVLIYKYVTSSFQGINLVLN